MFRELITGFLSSLEPSSACSRVSREVQQDAPKGARNPYTVSPFGSESHDSPLDHSGGTPGTGRTSVVDGARTTYSLLDLACAWAWWRP
jgi:hypothetical protein